MPATREALIIALLAIVPGWIYVQVWARNKTWAPPTTDLRTVLQAISASLVIQILAWPILGRRVFDVRDHLQNHTTLVVWWLALVVLLIPFVAGLILGKLSDLLDQQNIHGLDRWLRFLWPASLPSAWDLFFAQRIPDGGFLTIMLDDGKIIAGAFGSQSYVTTTPQDKGIYLEVEWLVDANGFITNAVPNSGGILIHDATKIKWIRVQRGST